jgi:hypothetical protein
MKAIDRGVGRSCKRESRKCGDVPIRANCFRIGAPSPLHWGGSTTATPTWKWQCDCHHKSDNRAGARAMTPGLRRLGAARICPRIRDRRPCKQRISCKPSCAARQPAKRRSFFHSPTVPDKKTYSSRSARGKRGPTRFTRSVKSTYCQECQKNKCFLSPGSQHFILHKGPRRCQMEFREIGQCKRGGLVLKSREF